MPRNILYISNPTLKLESSVARGIEMAVNHLGLKMTRHTMSMPPLSRREMTQYTGIIIWLTYDASHNKQAYLEWLSQQIRRHKKVIVFVQPNINRMSDQDKNMQRTALNKLLRHMDMSLGHVESGFPLMANVRRKVSRMVEFERKLDHDILPFIESRSLRSDNTVYLQLEHPQSKTLSDAVVVTKTGGVVVGNYVYYAGGNIIQWRINPFLFFSRALGIDHVPRMDVTTRNGHRIFYSHIDGDGFKNTSFIGQQKQAVCADVIYRSILKAYPALPVSVSVITADIDPNYFGTANLMSLARKIYKLKNVEPASHTFSHPLIWNKTEQNDGVISQYKAGLKRKNFVFNNNALLSYNIEGYHYHPTHEIVESVAYINQHLLPRHKQCRMVFWSGDTRPDHAAMKAAADHNVLNINGGDSQFDDLKPSYFYVAPLYRKVGPYYQIYTSQSNEVIYTQKQGKASSDLTASFQSLIDTFGRTESPKRVSPVNIYYHFFLGESAPYLKSLQHIYDWAAQQVIFPIFTSRYIEIVHGFIDASIRRIGHNRWEVSRNGQCRTVRFDRTALFPDLEQSTRIIGYKQFQNNLYIHLDEGKSHHIVLTDDPPDTPCLLDATADITQVSVTMDTHITFRTEFLDRMSFRWQHVSPNTYFTIRQTKGQRQIAAATIQSDHQGILTASLNGTGAYNVSIQLAR